MLRTALVLGGLAVAVPLALSAVAVAPIAASPGEITLHSVASDGATRWFRVSVPSDAVPGEPLPVVLGFHGGGGNALQFGTSSGLIEAADTHGALLVLPEGTGVLGGPPFFALQTWNGGACCGFAQENDVDDVQFVADLLDALDAVWPYDEERVFATGMSNGGIMSYRLGAELTGRITAIAPVAGANMTASFPPSPIPLMAIHGALDENVPFFGGVGVGPSGTDFVAQVDGLLPFFAANQSVLDATPERVVGAAELHVLPGLTGADVHYWYLADHGHLWPGGEPSVINPNEPATADLDASDEVLRYFLETVAP